MELERIERALRNALGRDQRPLLETEGLEILQAMGIAVPKHLVIPGIRADPRVSEAELAAFPGDRVVLKALSRDILHKTELGAVVILPKRQEALLAEMQRMESALARTHRIEGFLLEEFIPYDPALGGDLLLGMRWTEDFGPIVSLGPGGIHSELLSSQLLPGTGLAVFSPQDRSPGATRNALGALGLLPLLTGTLRGREPRIGEGELIAVIDRFLDVADRFIPGAIRELEINPLVVTGKRLVALDVLVIPGPAPSAAAPARPLEKLRNLLEPRTIALAGVSGTMNPGRIILKNTLGAGFDPEAMTVIKPGMRSAGSTQRIEGCRCVDDVQALTDKVDLLVLAISASQIPGVLAEVIENRKAEAVVVIPGGLEEKEGTEALVARMQTSLATARASDWRGPVINGGNCLGIRSVPGRYDTFFIPENKLPAPRGPPSPVAVISQSGAFAISRISDLTGVNPRFAISVGNQMDLTAGDYLVYLKDDPDIDVYAVYLEGFKLGDGARFLAAAREITAAGKTVLLYRAGRTAAGAQASSSHTASIAGDYAVTRQLCRSAGVVLADSLAEFGDLIKLFTFLRGRAVTGRRLGALSNAGFECVAFADHLGSFVLPELEPGTVKRLGEVFAEVGISGIVDVHNPLDLTPMCADAEYERAIRALLEDGSVDVAILGCVPLTPALQTLPRGAEARAGAGGDLSDDSGIARRLIRIKAGCAKPFVVVVEGGALYDPMVRLLEENAVPTFRTADRAINLLSKFCEHRLAAPGAGAHG